MIKVTLLFVDRPKAFDTVNHNILSNNLLSMYFDDWAYSWFKLYLSGGVQTVVTDSFKPKLQIVDKGVPQGFMLSPLLFILYINIWFPAQQSNMHFYADDTIFSRLTCLQ